MPVRDYELSPAADGDICDIYDYSLTNFGAAQAARNIGDLEPVFLKLALQPKIGRKRSDIRAGLYSLHYQSHVIFYRILRNRIRIVRILHQSRDLHRHI